MHFETKHWYHVYNRGNNHQQIFFTRQNYLYFLKKVRKQIVPLANVLAYCLIPNHFHLLIRVKPNKIDCKEDNRHPLIHNIAITLSSYTQAINKQENRSGSLFKSKTKAKDLSEGDNNYGETCFYYIHRNPLNAGLVEYLCNWEFSSYQDYAGIRNGNLLSQKLACSAFGIIDHSHFIRCAHHNIDPDKRKQIF